MGFGGDRLIDHVLAVVFAIGFPLFTTRQYHRRKAAMLAGDRSVKRREYLETIAWLSAMGIATLVVWVALGREFSLLGFSFVGGWTAYAGLGIAVIGSLLLMLQARAIMRDEATREAAREALAPVREFLPTTLEDVRLFRGVSLSAGIGEEIYYRGFLIWYLTLVMSPVWALVISSIAFGLAHVMHGVQSTVRSTIMGAVLGGLYILSGSLWASMILHYFIDISSGLSGFAAFKEGESTPS